MRRFIGLGSLFLALLLLGGEKPVTNNTTIPIWSNKTVGDSIASDTFNTHLTQGKGKFYATYIVTNADPTKCKVNIYAQFTNLRDANGKPIWIRPGLLIDSLVGPDSISKQIRILGHLLHRYRAVSIDDDNGNTKITMTVEVK